MMLASALFAQGILAAQACVAPTASAVQALSIESGAEAMPCHQAEKPNANACLIHCTQSDQVNLEQHHVAAAPVGDVVLHVVMTQVRQQLLTPGYSPLVLNTGPPLSVRFCSFLI